MQPYKNIFYNLNSLLTISILQKVVEHGFLWEIEEGCQNFCPLTVLYEKTFNIITLLI